MLLSLNKNTFILIKFSIFLLFVVILQILNNKTAMRIMQLYRIQHDYKGHKRRLQSIQSLNSKQRVIKATSQHFYLSNQRKKIKLNAEIFHEREELSRREKHNELMCKTISQHSKRIRQQYQSALMAGNHQERVLKRGGESERIEQENAKLREKLEKMKSVYKQNRKHSDLSLPSHLAQRQRSRHTEKEKLIRMLKTQFKIDPIVTFPRSQTKTNANDIQQEQLPKQDQGIAAKQMKPSEQASLWREDEK